MRRCKDDWVNATQILKCCRFPKAKRTKILEKGVQQGLHQKIQGGYGRFQGTWIPLPDAQKLASTYGLHPNMAPVLYFNPSNPGFELSKKSRDAVNKDGTPIKRKYVKKKKVEGSSPKKFKRDDLFEVPAASVSSDSFNSASRMSSQIAGYNGNMPVQYNGNFMPQEYMNNGQTIGTFQNQLPNLSMTNSSMQNDYQNYQMQVQMMQFQQQQQQQHQQHSQRTSQPSQFNYFPQPNSQHITPLHQLPAPHQPVGPQHVMGQFHHSKLPSSQSTNETNWSQDEQNKESDTSMSSNDETKGQLPKESYASQLLKFFSEENGAIPYFINNPPFDFNINEAIDDEGHTPLHWAASIGHYIMIHLLISKGANPLVVNNYGLNPLSKLISFNNCFEMKNFPKVLDDLEICLINTDINGRTPLHYLCQFSKVLSKYESLRYYLGVILNKLTSMTNQTAANKTINLLKNVLDHQDVNGDTCLHLAAKAGCSKLVKFLLSYNARDDLYNVSQETAKYLIMRDNLLSSRESPKTEEPNPMNQLDSMTESHMMTMKQMQMSTPRQSKHSRLETPDTQRTTVQEDDDEDDDHSNARVDKHQLNQLLKTNSREDDKENIFLESMKPFDSMSTPIQASKSNSYLSNSLTNQPLAVISERTAENTPTSMENSKESITETGGKVESYNAKPPKLDDDGKLKDSIPNKPIDTGDLSQMLSTMVKSLANSYQEKMEKAQEQETYIKQEIVKKESTNEKLMYNVTYNLTKLGVEEFTDLQQAHEALEGTIKQQEDISKTDENQLANKLEKIQAFQLARLVSSNEDNLAEVEVNDNETKFDLAVELTKQQLKRSNLLLELIEKIKFYGIDDKMYKYRKLISLSCGLNVNEIDCLIDGIEESLMEAKQ